VSQAGTKPQIEIPSEPILEEGGTSELDATIFRERLIERLRILWNRRQFLARAVLAGAAFGCLMAFLLPVEYESSAQLMPPDAQSGAGMAMLTSLAARNGNGLGAVAGDLLGVKSSGALFVGILSSHTVQNRLVERFQLKKAYGIRLGEDARQKLAKNTGVSEDRKSGIITITVTDHEAKRAASIAQAYVEELDQLVAELSTSSAHRERVFLEERLTAVKQDLDQASREFSQFASKNATIDIKEQGRAMVEAAATLQGELIADESELKGLEQIYTASNVRVRSVQARIDELRHQLEKLGGKGAADGADSAGGSDSLYPSIRKLPLLGVAYADLYRRTKIQEAVYETLTQQDELAKVQEVRETPSVKVLDAAAIPERKSFPPRTMIVFLCVSLTLFGAVLVVLTRARWEQIGSNDPSKVFTQEVLQAVNAYMPWTMPNGSRLQAFSNRIWVRVVRRGDSAESPVSRSN
jgi:capsule polysaccharide export protein KpsE/RkpR